MRKYLNTKGSAMMLVLCSMMILLAVSSVVIMLSTANITMSRKYSNWSEDYYQLDYVTEDRLATLDKTILIPAENLSRYYLENNYYQYEKLIDFPSGGESNSMSTAINQLFQGSSDLQPLIYTKWSEINSAKETSSYDQTMQAFVSDLFKLLYYAYINQNSSSIDVTKTYDTYNIQSTLALKTTNWFPASSTDFDSMCSGVSIPQVSIKSKELETENPKMVDALIDLNPPAFKAVAQNKYYAVKANPLYANALSVQGSITFQEGTTNSVNRIVGDVVSNNADKNGNPFDLGEGNHAGIQALQGAKVSIYGNVYSAGDLHLWGSNSSITVSPYSSPSFVSSLSLKPNLLYSSDNPYFFDFAASRDTNLYMKEAVDALPSANKFVPYIYKDNSGGNVYCNNLAIEDQVENGNLTVSGNLWTQDDIQNDAINSKIIVGKNYIGMRSDANEAKKDPNGSSSVINNGYMYGSTITIGGDFIIPGTAFFQFDGNQYYQTAESGTARAGEYFDLYLKGILDEGTPKVFGTYLDLNGEDKYDLYEKESGASTNALTDRIARFQDGLNALKANDSEHIKSGITVGQDKQNYTLGVVNNEGTVVYHATSDAYVLNHLKYSEVSGKDNLLDQVFKAKTQCYGTNGVSFSNLIDRSVGKEDRSNGFYSFPENASVNVSDITSGIIYCGGDLTLTGNGTFQGSVICAGNLTVNAGVNITYDESVIRQVLGLNNNYQLEKDSSGSYPGSHTARQFFSPSSYAAFKTLGVETISGASASAGERESASRYTINMWKEAKA